MNTRNAIRKGLIPVANPGEDYGKIAAGRIRTLAGMKREVKNRKAAIKIFRAQAKKAKGNERSRTLGLIQKYQAKIKALNKAIKAKQERKASRQRGFTRFKTRVGVYSGIGQYYHDSHDLSGLGDYWNQYTDWWSQQNRLVQIAVPSLFLLAAVKAYPHAKKAVKKVLK